MDAILQLLVGETGLSLAAFAFLCGISFLGSLIAAALGLGGGVLVLACMALVLPPTVLIPVHGVVQFGSNAGRALLMVRQVLLPILPAFILGTVIGAAVGAQIVVSLPTGILKGVLAAFIIYATWAPKFRARKPTKPVFAGVGAAGALATMFVGATGPLIAPFVAAACDDRRQVVATHGMLMTIQHLAKVIAFGALGFAFGPYLPLLVGLLLFGFLGTYAGKLVLNKLPEHVFRNGLKAVLTALALKLFYDALKGSGLFG